MKDTKVTFSLYITGKQKKNASIIRNITKVCTQELSEHVDLSIIDIQRDPEAAKLDKVLVTPTLIKNAPLPRVRMIGDFSSSDEIKRMFRQVKLASKKKQN